MKITRAQMAVFERWADETFGRQVADVLRRDYPDAVGGLSDDLLQRRVLHGVARARGRGLRVRANVAAYVTLMFVVAPGFDEAPHLAGWLSADGERDAAFEGLLWDTTDAEWLAARAAWQAQTEGAPA